MWRTSIASLLPQTPSKTLLFTIIKDMWSADIINRETSSVATVSEKGFSILLASFLLSDLLCKNLDQRKLCNGTRPSVQLILHVIETVILIRITKTHVRIPMIPSDLFLNSRIIFQGRWPSSCLTKLFPWRGLF